MNSRAKTILETKKDNFKHVGEVKADETWGRMKMNAPRPFQYMWRILKKQDRRNTIELEMLERIRRPLRNWNRIL